MRRDEPGVPEYFCWRGAGGDCCRRRRRRVAARRTSRCDRAPSEDTAAEARIDELHRGHRRDEGQAGESRRFFNRAQRLSRQERQRTRNSRLRRGDQARPVWAEAYYNRAPGCCATAATWSAPLPDLRAGGAPRQAQHRSDEHAEPHLLRQARLRALDRDAQSSRSSSIRTMRWRSTTAAWRIAPRASPTARFPTMIAPSSSIGNDAVA